ncbi:hypothetical protein Vafri_19079 [Volvox africanus]|uniref:Retinol dehydrogenase 12 n=1 Tax=Volvox africanus TaxID=51714 RepID=A0A8J4FBR0_9CHLO|nr:hypothetical protein Vafri_19079 [Volvox africanus]
MSWWNEFISGLRNVVIFTYDIIFQKWGMRHLPRHIDDVGGPVEGLTAIVTGPTSGIGEETAAALVRRGAKVVLACRSQQRGDDLRKALLAAAAAAGKPQPDVEVRILDLASLDSVRQFARSWEAEKRPLHILINNAGVFTIGAPRAETKDGFELHMGSNHLGHFLLTLMLLPAIRRGVASLAAVKTPGGGSGLASSSRCRIVTVSSSYHLLARTGISLLDPHLARDGAFNADLAYAQSKLANILFTRELRRRLAVSEPDLAKSVFALHPGLVCTAVARDLPYWMRIAYNVVMGRVLLNSMQGARASIYCATSPTAPAEGAATDGYINLDCRAIRPSEHAQNDRVALWLWRWSAEQVGLDPSLDLPEP